MSLPTFELGPIRPPSEATSLLIRVTRNCPWNRCRFCATYKGARFGKRTAEEVKRDIDAVRAIADELRGISWRLGQGGRIGREVLEAAAGRAETDEEQNCLWHVGQWLHHGGRRVFLQDANSLALPADRLADVLGHLARTFPEVDRVTTYARSQTIARSKTASDLAALRRAGLGRVHVGMESGSARVLEIMDKGVTPEEHVAAGRRVVESGLELSLYFMPGAGGRELSAEHAAESARVLAAIGPHFIRLRTFTPVPGTPMADDIESGALAPLDEDGVAREIRAFVAALSNIPSRVASDHVMNLLEEVEGLLPGDRGRMLAAIDRYLGLDEDERVLFRVGRRTGLFRGLGDLGHPGLRARAAEARRMIEAEHGDVDRGLRALAWRYI